MHARSLRYLLAAAASAVLIAGCGGDDGDSSTAGADTQPAEELVSQADAICADADKQRPKPPELPVDPSAKELRATADYLETDLDVTTDTLTRLSDLAPPEGLEEQWATVLDGFQAVIDDYPALIDAAAAGDDKAFIETIGKIQTDTEDLQPAAAEVGLKVCATPG